MGRMGRIVGMVAQGARWIRARTTALLRWQYFRRATLHWRLRVAQATTQATLRWTLFRLLTALSECLIDLAWHASSQATRWMEDRDARILAALWPETAVPRMLGGAMDDVYEARQGRHTLQLIHSVSYRDLYRRYHAADARPSAHNAPVKPVAPPAAIGKPTPPSWPLTSSAPTSTPTPAPRPLHLTALPPLPAVQPPPWVTQASLLPPLTSAAGHAAGHAAGSVSPLAATGHVPVSVSEVAFAVGLDMNPPDAALAVGHIVRSVGKLLSVAEHRPADWRAQMAEYVADIALCLPADVDRALAAHLFLPEPPLSAPTLFDMSGDDDIDNDTVDTSDTSDAAIAQRLYSEDPAEIWPTISPASIEQFWRIVQGEDDGTDDLPPLEAAS